MAEKTNNTLLCKSVRVRQKDIENCQLTSAHQCVCVCVYQIEVDDDVYVFVSVCVYMCVHVCKCLRGLSKNGKSRRHAENADRVIRNYSEYI